MGFTHIPGGISSVVIGLLVALIAAMFCFEAHSDSGVLDTPLELRQAPEGVPVLASGYAHSPLFVIDSCVLKDDEGYHLFFSSFFATSPDGLTLHWDLSSPELYDFPKLTTAIAYAFSSDEGLHWRVRSSPILTPGEDAWDSHRVETANAIVHDDVLHVFYCADGTYQGEPFTARYQIGVASLNLEGVSLREAMLEQGRVVSRTRHSPLLAHVVDKSCFLNNVQEPSILWRDGRFELYFVGLRLALPDKSIDAPGQELSDVGMGRAVLDESLDVIEISAEPILKGVNILEIKHVGGRYLMFSTAAGTGGDAHKGEQLELYTSADGLEWSTPTPIFGELPRQGFDSWARMSPTFVHDAGQLVLFYTGLEVMKMDTDDRWGLPFDDGQHLFASLGRATSSWE